MIEQISRAWVPVIDLRHCKGCGKCVEACPLGVLEVHNVNSADYEQLGWFARMKIRHHGMLAACAIRTDDCRSCGQCLEACREHAIHKDSSLRSEADPRVSVE